MAIYPLIREHVSYHRGQIERLTPETQRLWGEMTVERMLAHLRVTTEMSLDPDLTMKPLAPWPVGSLLGWVFFDVYTTWPKGKLKAIPALLPEGAQDFATEKALLLSAMDTFVARCDTDPELKTFHPLMGKVTLRRWAHAHGPHMNHHYRQFGLV